MPKKSAGALKIFLWIAAISWAAVMFFFSGQDANESGKLSLWVTQHVLRLFPSIPLEFKTLHLLIRKTAHFCIFGLEGLLLGLAMMTTLPEKWLGAILAVISCAVVAVLNEYHQSFSKGRSCELRDMLIDSAGALTGVLAGMLVLTIICRISERRRNVIIS